MLAKSKLTIAIVAFACFFIGIALYINFYSRHTADTVPAKTSPEPATVIGNTRPDFTLQDTGNKPHSIKKHNGKVIVLNFWATWCPPCRREIPALIELQDKYREQGVALLGVAIDEAQSVIDFVDPMGINYPVLIAELEGIALTQTYGNHLGGLPYTVIIDRTGVIRHALMKELTLEEAETLIQPLL